MRIFVAVWPDDATAKGLSLLDIGPLQDLRIVRPEQWHVTLRFLGNVDATLVPTIIDALREAVTIIRAPVNCEIGPATRWLSGNKVLQIPVHGLDELAAAVRTASGPIVSEKSPSFQGHVTLARSRGRLSARARQGLVGMPFHSTFNVDYFDLVRSDISREGPRYTTLERFPLAE